MHRFLAVRDKGADQRRRDAQVSDAVPRGQRPQPVDAGIVRRAVVEAEGRPQQRGAENQPRSHHPAHVGDPVHHVAGMHIGAEGHVLGGLDREAAVGVDGAFRPAGRAAGVDEHQPVFGGGVFGFGRVRLRGHQLMPPVVAAGLHGHIIAGAAQDDLVGQRWHLGRCFVGHRFHGHNQASAISAVGGEERLSPRVGQPGDDGPRAVAGEERQDDAADLGDGQQGNGDLRRHGHVKGHAVAFAQTERAQGVGAAIDLSPQFAIGQGARRAFFAFPDQRRAVAGGRAGGPLVNAVVDDVKPPADAPARPLDAGRQIDDPRIGHAEANVEIFQHGVGEPGDVGRRPRHQLVIRGNSHAAA
jgi:hypothetical protein